MSDFILFSPEELSVIRDTRFFHIKAAVTPKVQEILRSIHGVFLEELPREDLLMPQGVDLQAGQFVKGEYLLNFPYLYLDFPKLFTRQEKFAFRTLFWWGHSWVFAWILEGGHLEHYKKNILGAYDRLADRGLHLLLTESPWEWRREKDFVLEIRKDNRKEVCALLETRSFLKIHRYLDFGDPACMEGNIVSEARDIFRLMRAIVVK